MATLNETRAANANVANEDNLIRKINTIEASVIDWMDKATELHNSVAAEDKQQVLDLRVSLIAKLSAATAI